MVFVIEPISISVFASAPRPANRVPSGVMTAAESSWWAPSPARSARRSAISASPVRSSESCGTDGMATHPTITVASAAATAVTVSLLSFMRSLLMRARW